MASQTIFQVRHNTFPALGEQDKDRAIVNRFASQIQVDFFTQLVLGGYAYHMQIGTENTGVDSTSVIDDILVWMIADNPDTYAMIPLLYEMNVGVQDGTLAQTMLEIDKDKVRWADDASGTLYVPANMRSDDNNTAVGDYRVGTDVVAAGKSAVPNSVELARKFITEDSLADTLGYPGAWASTIYSIADRPPMVLVDASSIIVHFGNNGTDCAGYGALQFAQFDKNLVV